MSDDGTSIGTSNSYANTYNSHSSRSGRSSNPSSSSRSSSRDGAAVVSTGKGSQSRTKKRHKTHHHHSPDPLYDERGRLLRKEYCDGFPGNYRLVPVDQPMTPSQPNDPHAQFNARFEQMQAEMATLVQQRDEYKAQLEGELATNPKKKSTEAPNKGMLKRIDVVFRNDIWRSFKFVSCKKQEDQVAEAVFDKMDLGPLNDPKAPKFEENRTKWLENYTEECTKVLNSIRSYVQSRMKEVAFRRMSQQKTLPPLSLILKFMRREELDFEGDKAIKDQLTWWVDEMMPKMTANGTHFGTHVRWYKPIFDSRINKGPIEMPPSTEAFGVLLYENCRAKWTELFELKKKNPNNQLHVLLKRKDPEVVPKNKNTKFVYVDENPKLATKYTAPEVGQAKYGGWKLEGMTQFAKYRKQNKTARQTKEGQELEVMILNELRKRNGIKCDNHEDQRRSDGRRKTGNPAIAPVIEVEDLYSSDEEDGQEESQMP